MTTRSHLTPTATTDRNGRSTTVYRNLQGRGPVPGASAIPGPPPAARGTSRSRTPLPPIAERSAEEIAAFLERPRAPFEPLAASHGWLKDTPGGREAVSLAIDLTERGVLAEADALAALAAASPRGPEAFPTDALRMAARLSPYEGECDGTLWEYEVIAGVGGVYNEAKAPREHRLATEEEFAAAAAVVRFTLRFGYHVDRVGRGTSDLSGEGDRVISTRVRNPHLGRLIARRPEDIGRIIDYVDERGMHPSRKKDVDDLRDWLDAEGSDAVADGWL